MNLLEWGIQLGVMVVGLTALLWLFRRSRAAERSIVTLSEQLALYTETSISLAATVQRVLLTPDARQAASTSRHYLLRQARVAAGEGRPIEHVAGEYRLSNDEALLLAASARSRREPPARESRDPGATRGYAEGSDR